MLAIAGKLSGYNIISPISLLTWNDEILEVINHRHFDQRFLYKDVVINNLFAFIGEKYCITKVINLDDGAVASVSVIDKNIKTIHVWGNVENCMFNKESVFVGKDTKTIRESLTACCEMYNALITVLVFCQLCALSYIVFC